MKREQRRERQEDMLAAAQLNREVRRQRARDQEEKAVARKEERKRRAQEQSGSQLRKIARHRANDSEIDLLRIQQDGSSGGNQKNSPSRKPKFFEDSSLLKIWDLMC